MKSVLAFILLIGIQSQAQQFINVPNRDTNVVDLFYIGGQSNTARPLTTSMTADQLARYGGPRANTYIFNPYVSTTQFNQLNVGENCYTEGGDIRQFGPQASLFQELQWYYSWPRYFVNFGIGGTSMNGVWRPGLTNFNNITTYLDTAISLIVAQGKTPRFVAFIWIQGETDATNQTNAGLYQQNLINFFDSITSRVNVMYSRRSLPTPNFKKVVYKIGNNPKVNYTYANVVRQAQEFYVRTYGHYLINSDSFPFFDDEHFSATGQIMMGTAIFNLVKNL